MAPIAINTLTFARCFLFELSRIKDSIPETVVFKQTPIDNAVVDMSTESLEGLHSFCLRYYNIYRDEEFIVVGFDIELKCVKFRFQRNLKIVRIKNLSHYGRWLKALAKKAVCEINSIANIKVP